MIPYRRKDYHVPRFKYQAVDWLKRNYPAGDWSSMNKKQIFAIYHQKMQERLKRYQ